MILILQLVLFYHFMMKILNVSILQQRVKDLLDFMNLLMIEDSI